MASEKLENAGDITTQIKKLVEDYARSENRDDLVLSPDYTKEERALIHEHARELGLKSKSRGKANRVLTLSKIDPEMASQFRVDKYRDPDECAQAWRLRRRFLVAHHDKFPEAHLICLAKCFVNVEMHGCRYPDPVMIQLKELSKDFPKLMKEKRETVKMKYMTMGFLKGSDSDTVEPAVKKSFSDTVFHVKTYPVNDDTNDQTFAALRHQIRQKSMQINPVSLMNIVIHKVKMTIQTSFDAKEVDGATMFECKVSIDHIHIASAVDRNKKTAKKAAFENVIKTILKPYHKIFVNEDNCKELFATDARVFEEDESEESEEDETPMLPKGQTWYESNAGSLKGQRLKNYKRKMRPQLHDAKNLDELIIMQDAMNSSAVQHPSSLLRQSADFSKMLLEFEFVRKKEGVSCRVSLEGQPLIKCTAKTTIIAKNEASANAIDLLKKMCWTIKFKQAADSDAMVLSKEEVFGDVEKSMCQIPESNIGNKLLRKMGWMGGGVGKDGTGRAEPVSVEQVINRAGIGHSTEQGITGNMMSRIRTCVENYARSDNCRDLVFSTDFIKEERALIQQHAKRLRLKSRCRGSNKNRYIIVSRTSDELFEHILSQGGSTSKYELVPPQRSYMNVEHVNTDLPH